MKRTSILFISKTFFLYFICFFIFPLSVLEIFSQFRFTTGYAFEFITSKKDPTKIGNRPGNVFYLKNYKTIYGDTTKIKKVIYRTDQFGTIFPSTISNAKNKIQDSTLFCGGSTTEASSVPEGKRPPDIYTKLTGIPSINASMSGKDLSGCIKTIRYFFKNHGKPKNIVIANNVNTLMWYGRDLNKFENHREIFSKKSILKKSFHFFTPGLAKARFHIKKQENETKLTNDMIFFENRLLEGCCHGAGMFNKKNKGLNFKWEDLSIQSGYKEKISNLVLALQKLLETYDYDKKNIYVFIEPNSFLNPSTSGSVDYRQFLHDENGIKVSGVQSAEWTKIYDDIYLEVFKENNFKILKTNTNQLSSNYFYDAVHLSPEGSKFIGNFYSENLTK